MNPTIFRPRLLILFLCLSLSGFAQNDKKALSLDDYPEWSSIGSVNLSDNGQWMSYSYRPNEGDDTLYFKNLKSQEIIQESFCSNPAFSDDSKWIAFYQNLTEKETKKLVKSKQTVYKKAVLMNLADRSKIVWDKASGFSFSPNSDFLLIEKGSDSKDFKGKDLILYSLLNKWSINLGNVSQYKFNSQGTHMAYLVDAADKAGNGIFIFKLASQSLIPLDTDTLTYSQLVWDDEMLYPSEKGTKGNALAVLKGEKPDTLEQSINSLLVISDINSIPIKKVFTSEDLSGMPKGYLISDLGRIQFSLDNNRLSIPIKEQEIKVKLSKDSIANVDVWHWGDEQIQSVQMIRASREKRNTYTGILHLGSGKFIQLSSDDLRSVSLNRNLDMAIGNDPKPYIDDTNWGGGYSDYYQVNTTTGIKKMIENKIGRAMGMSPDGKYFLYFKNKDFHLYNLEKGENINLTNKLDVSFFDTEEDHPYENPSYGIEGWSKDGKSIILNHRYDIWAVSLDGSGGRNLTGNYGSEQEIKFGIINLEREPGIDLKKDVYLSAYGEWTKKAGFYMLKDGKAPRKLLFDDASYGSVRKAREADVFLFTKENFVDFPDYYTAGSQFDKLIKQTDANPQQANYLWGERILVDFQNSHGDKLQGTLTLPAGYEKGKKYPMLVYFYEKMSQRHNTYSMPTYDDRPHMSTYASNGYLVFMPDIKYYEGQPGNNAVDCVTSAVKKVIDLGYADPDKIGLQGHSWGGYESSFILTQSDMFACVVTGAPVTNLTSMYNILYKNSGTNNHGIMETGQVRMGKGMYDDMENYAAQSPVLQAAGISAPFMILHGTVDGAVDWNQGLEFYNAARRLDKEVILLSYPNENHHLANLNNQKDFQIRMKQYFDHYLKGEAAPEWMVTGIKFVDKLYEKAK